MNRINNKKQPYVKYVYLCLVEQTETAPSKYLWKV